MWTIADNWWLQELGSATLIAAFLWRADVLPEDSTPLILGCRVTFADGQSAKLTAFEVDESWEVLNIVVSRGFLRWTESVKLPFSAATRWNEASVELSCESAAAFAREVPPIAAPARPISADVPVAAGASRVIGALVIKPTRRLAEMIVRIGPRRVRVPASEVSFEGKVLHITTAPDTLPEYRPDEEIAQEAFHRLSNDRAITPDEIRTMEAESTGGVVTLTGNVRRKETRLRAAALVSGVAGIGRIDTQIADDLQIETDLGWALERAAVQRTASIQGRSSLGEVVLYGHAPSGKVVEDAIRAASGVAGVRKVTSRVQVGRRPTTAAA